ncbi:MAG: type III pantothenate kinase, partial [Coprococcus sp.]
MIFVIDIGNSNIVAGLMDHEKNVLFSGRIRTDRRKTKEEFLIELKTLLDIYKVSLDGIQGGIISSV